MKKGSSSKRKARRISRKKLTVFVLVATAVIAVCIVMIFQTIKTNRKNEQMEARKARLNELIAEQEQRTQDLEDEAVYVQTQKYIEEKAKSIGYVYPDEIIFKEDDE